MRFLVLVFALCCSIIAFAQEDRSKVLTGIGQEMCKHMDSLDAVDTDEYFIVTIDRELDELIKFTPIETIEAFKLETETDPFDGAYEVYPLSDRSLLAAFLENCPAGRERYLIQQMYAARADTLLNLEEWETMVDFALIEFADAALENDELTISNYLVRELIASSVNEDWRSLEVLVGDDLAALLINALAITKPKIMTRYQVEVYNENNLMRWAERNYQNQDRNWIKDLALEDEAAILCEKVEKLDVENLDTDFSFDAFSPDEASINLLKTMYPVEIPHYHFKILMGAFVMQDAMESCETFRNFMMMQLKKSSIASLELKPEEEDTFAKLSEGLCKCVEISIPETAKKCYNDLLKTFGVTDENSFFLEAAEKDKRILEMVYVIGQSKEAFCSGTGE